MATRLSEFDSKITEIQQRVQLNEQKVDTYHQNLNEREAEIERLKLKLNDLDLQRENLMTELESGNLEIEQPEGTTRYVNDDAGCDGFAPCCIEIRELGGGLDFAHRGNRLAHNRA